MYYNMSGARCRPSKNHQNYCGLKKTCPKHGKRRASFLTSQILWCTKQRGPTAAVCVPTCANGPYLGHESRWDRTFFDAIGLGDLFDDGKVTEDVAPMGEYAGTLSAKAANLMGLTTQTAVGVGIIDAHAGGIGVGVSETDFGIDRRHIIVSHGRVKRTAIYPRRMGTLLRCDAAGLVAQRRWAKCNRRIIGSHHRAIWHGQRRRSLLACTYRERNQCYIRRTQRVHCRKRRTLRLDRAAAYLARSPRQPISQSRSQRTGNDGWFDPGYVV